MIDFKRKILLGGLPQKIHIKGDNDRNPLLLFLHGGPGVCNRHTILTDHADLQKTFTVVTWDQRGSGGSYWGAKKDTLTIDRLVEDANDLINWLCALFQKDKIFIIGGSWGSELGTYLAQRHPEKIAAYVGFGQVVNGARNEEISFDFAMTEAVKAGDEASVAILKKVGPPVMGVYKGGFKGMMAQRRVMMKYGGYSQSEKKRSYFHSFVIPVFKSGEYSLTDLIGLVIGYKYVLTNMWNAVGETDFPRTCTKFDVPFFVFDGALDQNTPASLVQDWFDTITAPQKELIWFEQSGHNPMGDEPARFKSLLIDRLTAIAKKEKNV